MATTVLPAIDSPRGSAGRHSARGIGGMHQSAPMMSGGNGLHSKVSRRGTERDGYHEESDLRRLRRENAELQEELSRVQQSPREDAVTSDSTRKVEERIIALRLECNRQKTLYKQKSKQMDILRAKMLAADMETEPESERAAPFTMRKTEGKENSSLPEDENAMLEATVRILEEKGTCRQAAPPTFTPGLALRQHYEELVRSVADMEAGIFAVNYQKKTLQQIISRLSSERQGMEAYYINLKANLGGVNRQQEEQELNIKQLQHTEEATRSRINSLQEEVAQIRKRRDELIGQQRAKLTKQNQMERYMSTRDSQRMELISEIEGDLNAAEEARLRKESKEQAGQRAGQVMTLHHLEKVEAAFKLMADRTGETDLNEILKRMIYLDSVNKGLDETRIESERRLEQLNKDQGDLALELTGIQLDGMGQSHQRQQMEDLEKRLDTAEFRADEHRGDLTRYMGLLSPLQLGMDLIDSKLLSFTVSNAHKDRIATISIADDIVNAPDSAPAEAAEGGEGEAAHAEVASEMDGVAVDESKLVKTFAQIEKRLFALLEIEDIKELIEMRHDQQQKILDLYTEMQGRPRSDWTPAMASMPEPIEEGDEEEAAAEEAAEGKEEAAAEERKEGAVEGAAEGAEGAETAAAAAEGEGEGAAAAAAAAEGEGEGEATAAEGEGEGGGEGAAAPAPAAEDEAPAPEQAELELPGQGDPISQRFQALPRVSHGLVSGMAPDHNFRVQLRSNTPALSDKAEDDDDDDDVDETEIEALLDNTDISLTHHLAKQAILMQAERRAKKKGMGFKVQPTPPTSTAGRGGGRSGRYKS